MQRFLLGLVFLAACGGSGRTTGDAGAIDDGGTGDGAPPGAACGGFANRKCAATEYCDYPDNTCGIADQAGRCQPRPDVCPATATAALVATPTCACDGKVYSSECEAFRGGADLNAGGGCPVPAGKFACGYTQCALATQYCQRQPHTGGADTFVCATLPSCPAAPSCDCLRGEPCGSSCDGDAGVGLTLTCAPTA
jgi:hypothetical protein